MRRSDPIFGVRVRGLSQTQILNIAYRSARLSLHDGARPQLVHAAVQ